MADAILGRKPALVNAIEHFHHLDVGSAVQRTQSAQTAASARGEQIGLGDPTTRTSKCCSSVRGRRAE